MRMLCLGLLACSPAKPFDPGTAPDTDVVDTDLPTAPGTACTGELSVTMAGVPEFQQLFPLSWQDQDADLTIGGFGSGRTYVTKETDGCMVVDSGEVTFDLRGTKCAASKVRVTLESLCPEATCVTVEVYADEERRGSTRSQKILEREVVELAPSSPFLQVRLAAVEFRLCGISVDRAPVPDDLRPADTAEPF